MNARNPDKRNMQHYVVCQVAFLTCDAACIAAALTFIWSTVRVSQLGVADAGKCLTSRHPMPSPDGPWSMSSSLGHGPRPTDYVSAVAQTTHHGVHPHRAKVA